MKRKKRLTKRQRKALDTRQRPGPGSGGGHIHCIACGRHIDPGELEAAIPGAMTIVCDHGGRFPACTGCEAEARRRVAEHDRTGQAVQTAAPWH